jgi:CheY-like chemotaxis protein
MCALYVRKVLFLGIDEEAIETAVVSIRDVGRWMALVARSVEEALQIAACERPEVILLDSALCRGDAGATLAALRAAKATATIPIVLLVGAEEHRRKATRHHVPLGARGVIKKPINPLALPQRIRELVGAKSGPAPEVLFRGK